ncbi:hypothetical protein [Candidatus Rariloculus sp.]|uniref:hypothetical protein n=1 Tax=Candidatus Rariloculus sp. TaxID=3101265 RepID=UPI003D104A60
MKEWRQTITSICTVVLAIAALATMMQFQFAGVRAEMRAEHDVIRMQMGDEHAAMRGELADVRDQVISVDRRTARIEGHLFGIEIAPDPQDSG